MSTARIRPADIAEVQAFVAAVRTGSLSRAAVELRVSTPAIAKRMRQLETLAGRPLLERSNRGVRLTPAGRAVFDDATRLVEAADSLFTVLDGTSEQTSVAGLQSLLQRPSETTPSTESILAEAEQLLARLFQTTREGLVISRPSDGMIFEANDAFCSLLGFRREQLVGRTSIDLLLWADRADRTYIVAHADADGTEPMQLRLRGADGELREVEVIASTIRLGGEERLLASFRGRSDVRAEDAAVQLPSLESVTERTLRDRAQREAEQQLRLAFEDAPVGIALATTSGKFLRVNRAFAAMLGYTSDELIGVPASSVTVPEDRMRDREQRSRLLERELEIDRRRKRFLDASGRVVTVDLRERIIRDDAGTALYMAALTDDVSEGPAAGRRFETLAEKAPVGIFEIEADGSCVWANTAMEALTGRTGDALLGTGWIAALHRDDRDRVAAALQLAAGGDDGLALEYRFETPTGTVSWIQGSATPLLDDAGTVSGCLGTATDVTERHIAESRLRDAMRELAVSERRSASQWRALARAIPNGFALLFDRDLRYLLADGNELAHLGYTREQIEGRTAREVQPAEIVDFVEERYRRALAGERCEWERRHEGRVFQLAAGPVRDGLGVISAGVVVAVEITRKTHA